MEHRGWTASNFRSCMHAARALCAPDGRMTLDVVGTMSVVARALVSARGETDRSADPMSQAALCVKVAAAWCDSSPVTYSEVAGAFALPPASAAVRLTRAGELRALDALGGALLSPTSFQLCAELVSHTGGSRGTLLSVVGLYTYVNEAYYDLSAVADDYLVAAGVAYSARALNGLEPWPREAAELTGVAAGEAEHMSAVVRTAALCAWLGLPALDAAREVSLGWGRLGRAMRVEEAVAGVVHLLLRGSGLDPWPPAAERGTGLSAPEADELGRRAGAALSAQAG